MRAFSYTFRKTDTNTARRVLILTGSNAVLQLIAFIYRGMLLRIAGSEALGLQSLVMQVYSLMVSVCISGLNVAVITLTARCGEVKKLRRITRCALGAFIVLFGLCALPVFVLRRRIAFSVIGDAGAAGAIALTLGCIFMTGIENILKSMHIASGREARTAASELMEQTARLIAVFTLIKLAHSGAAGKLASLIMLGMLLSEFVSVGFLSVSYKKHYIVPCKAPSGDRREVLSELIKILLPAQGTALCGTIFASAASLMLPSRLVEAGYTRSEALSAIGVLGSSAIPLVMLPMIFVGAVAVISMPKAAHANANADGRALIRITKKAQAASLAALIVYNLPLLWSMGAISRAIFGVEPTQLCVLLLSIKAGFIYLQATASAVMNGMMKQKHVFVFALIGETVQLALILILTPIKSLHIYGYLIAMCIGEGLRFALSSGYLFRILKRKTTTLANYSAQKRLNGSTAAVCRRALITHRSR